MRRTVLAMVAALVLLLGGVGRARADTFLISQSGFSGNQSVIDFTGLSSTPPAGPFTIGSVTFSESSTGNGGPGWRLLTGGGNTTGNWLTDNAGISDINLAFASPENRVGLFVCIGPATYQINVFDSGNNLLDTTSVTISSNGGQPQFVGFQSTSEIASLQVLETSGDNGLVGGIADVMFEPVAAAATPEPASLFTLGLGDCGMAGFAWKQRKKPVAA
jgi:hypothetical protein